MRNPHGKASSHGECQSWGPALRRAKGQSHAKGKSVVLPVLALVELPRNEKAGKIREQTGFLQNGNNYPEKLKLFLFPQRWRLPFVCSCPPGVALSTHFQVTGTKMQLRPPWRTWWGGWWWPHSPGLEEPSLILIGLAKLTRIVRPKSSDSFWKDGKFSCLNSVRVKGSQTGFPCSNLFSLNPWAPNSKLCTRRKAALGEPGNVPWNRHPPPSFQCQKELCYR